MGSTKKNLILGKMKKEFIKKTSEGVYMACLKIGDSCNNGWNTVKGTHPTEYSKF